MAWNNNTPVATNQIAADLVAINANWEYCGANKVAAAGDILYATAANTLTKLTIGTAGQILEVNAGATAPAWVSKGIVQVVSTQTGAVATGTTVMPYDDTIPQKTEGDEYMTLAITPASATNKLIIDAIWQGAFSVETKISVALFQDDTAGAIAAASARVVLANLPVSPIILRHYMAAGTTSATTFKIRAGGADAGTTTFNGISGGRIFGGVIASSITITELRA